MSCSVDGGEKEESKDEIDGGWVGYPYVVDGDVLFREPSGAADCVGGV